MNRDDLPPEDKLVRLAYLALLVANSLKNGQPEAAEGALMMICLEGGIYMTDPPPQWVQEANKRGLQLFAKIMANERMNQQ